MNESDYLLAVKRLSARRSRAGEKLLLIDNEWREAIRVAAWDGVSPTKLAAVAGVSRERIYQIKEDRR